jgi:hypothetical protein
MLAGLRLHVSPVEGDTMVESDIVGVTPVGPLMVIVAIA